MNDKHSLHSPPTVPIALWLGYVGLIPFVAGAALTGLLAPESRLLAASALLAYAAVTSSFLGGIHWGIGFRDGTSRLFLWGVVPSLVAAARAAAANPPRPVNARVDAAAVLRGRPARLSGARTAGLAALALAAEPGCRHELLRCRGACLSLALGNTLACATDGLARSCRRTGAAGTACRAVCVRPWSKTQANSSEMSK